MLLGTALLLRWHAVPLRVVGGGTFSPLRAVDGRQTAMGAKHKFIADEAPKFLILSNPLVSNGADDATATLAGQVSTKSKACYAAHHGYGLRMKDWGTREYMGYPSAYPSMGYPSAYWAKHAAFKEAMHDPACAKFDFLVWVDSDVLFLNASVPLHAFVTPRAQVVAADAGAGFNNGVLILRNSDFVRDEFLPRWLAIGQAGALAMDNPAFDLAVYQIMSEDVGRAYFRDSTLVSLATTLDARWLHVVFLLRVFVWGDWDMWWHYDQGPARGTRPRSSHRVQLWNGQPLGGLNTGCGWGTNAYTPGALLVHYAGMNEQRAALMAQMERHTVCAAASAPRAAAHAPLTDPCVLQVVNDAVLK